MLTVKELTYKVSDKVILNNVSVQVERGQILGVLGPNGAGKTSLLRHMSAQLSSQKSVFINERSLESYSQIELAKHISVVNQFNASVFALTLHDIVSMGLLPHLNILTSKNHAHEQHIQTALSQVGLEDKQNQAFSVLSGGEQQRGLIARALVQQTPIMILDEPVNHLDVYYQHQILALINSLARCLRLTVVISLHDLNLASAYCDQVCLLENGFVFNSGTPEEVFTQKSLQQVFKTPCNVKRNPENGMLGIEFFPHHVTDAGRAEEIKL